MREPVNPVADMYTTISVTKSLLKTLALKSAYKIIDTITFTMTSIL